VRREKFPLTYQRCFRFSEKDLTATPNQWLPPVIPSR
jgi:hypothetical protein